MHQNEKANHPYAATKAGNNKWKWKNPKAQPGGILHGQDATNIHTVGTLFLSKHLQIEVSCRGHVCTLMCEMLDVCEATLSFKQV